jgi:hypothetical protein
MTDKSEIIADIKTKIGRIRCDLWRIGLTNDVVTRRLAWRSLGHDVRSWKEWEADSLSDAREIETFYLRQGMEGGTGGEATGRQPVFVYIFRLPAKKRPRPLTPDREKL